MNADTKTALVVQSAIKQFTDAYVNRSLAGVMACFAADADVVLYGTGADEKRLGSDQIRIQIERDWSQTESLAMSFALSSISAAGPVAWAAVEGACNIRADGRDMTMPLRVSFVFENRGGNWLIVHAHFSTPTSGQVEGRSI